MTKNSPKQKCFISKECPFTAEQRGEVRFCVGYFVYEIRGIKRMRVTKATIVAFRK